MKLKSIKALLYGIIAVALVLTAAGLIIKLSAGKNAPRLKGVPSLSVPFMVLNDKTILKTAEPLQPEELESPAEEPVHDERLSPSDTDQLPETDDLPAEESEPEPSPEPEPIPEPEPLTFQPVGDDYFSDALFIGDSRTVGLALYAPIPGADYFATTGMTVFGIFDHTGDDVGYYDYLGTLLASKDYKKIYMMLGINEIESSNDSIIAAYQNDIDELKKSEPNAIIILMSNLVTTESMSYSVPRLSLENIHELNSRIEELADYETVFYLDINPIFTNYDGYLKDEYSWDGAHPYASEYIRWTDFIKENGLK